MANTNNKTEPSTAPQPDRWYNLSLGSSFKDDPPSSKFCTLRYEFKPASIDKNQPGTLNKTKDNKVTVEFHSNIPGKPKTVFEGTSSDDYKENDAVLLFDGETFRLERLHRAVKRLKRVWQPGESASAAAVPVVSGGPSGWVGGASESSSPTLEKGGKFQTPNKNGFPSVPFEVERIEIGDFKTSDKKPKNEKTVEQPTFVQENESNDSPDKFDDLDEQLDILNDDNDDAVMHEEGSNNEVKEFHHTGIDINIPHQIDTDDEIADVVASDDEATAGPSAAEALRAQVHAGEKKQETSSSSDSSGSDSSGSGSGSGSGSSSSSDSESSDGDSVNSV